ncbi:uncharacterized protein BO87DRAFT_418328 [Aspergillus neoniger CBS 115656]|uniref:Uncharacterized protein n=1 Tax=Aspergillus neoniger (strain CBS 115656) TaxID=1448310 RepID=A0A318YA98_ASPNB|nr:hypothetical protein BO87DRAFT_418328 [Aspergillus neoniger CBS 115656]PYH31265.1 hypothetical protein BO87DRAFT_418328 [Aspergillus neoniger CBS 115656]
MAGLKECQCDLGYWYYFPLNDQEDIQGAWIRNFHEYQEESESEEAEDLEEIDALILQTSLGRSVTFGPVFPLMYIECGVYTPMFKAEDGPVTGIFHDGLDPRNSGILLCGVTCDSSRSCQTPVFVPLRDTLAFPDKNPDDVCRNRLKPYRPCLGMLMFYDDGHVECSGQIRWDYGLEEEICAPIIVVRGVADGNNYIKDIQGGKGNVESTGYPSSSQILPAKGILAWWFNETDVRLAIYRD